MYNILLFAAHQRNPRATLCVRELSSPWLLLASAMAVCALHFCARVCVVSRRSSSVQLKILLMREPLCETSQSVTTDQRTCARTLQAAFSVAASFRLRQSNSNSPLRQWNLQ